MNESVQSDPKQLRRILVVDGEAEIRQIYSVALIRSGYQVHTAENGDVGFRVLHAVRNDPCRYDLLITDNKMPLLTGVQLVRKLRAASMALPVILASASPPTNTEGLQFAAILEKPFFPEHLVQIVAEVLHPDHVSASTIRPGAVIPGTTINRFVNPS
jgi:two-component system response regulator AtoC